MKRAVSALFVASALLASPSHGYPLDGTEETGITRLEAFYLAREALLRSGTLKPGAMHTTGEIELRLLDYPNFELPAPDPAFTAEVKDLLGADASAFGVTILDLSDVRKPRLAELNGNKPQLPGSVGKVVVVLAFFQALAEAYPDDIAARERILFETEITANAFIRNDEHKVPFWQPGDPKVVRRPIEEGDRANLWTFLDWMLSASSNAAAAMVQAQTLLLLHFGTNYPVSEAEAEAFFRDTPKRELSALMRRAMVEPVKKAGLNPDRLAKGSFFTREGKSRVSGTGSTSTSRELVLYMVRMEQGKLVDPWSSLMIKRLLYITDVRVRYASSPALDESAVYFKSGSLYSCKPEKGYVCEKYKGNRQNLMNSVAEVESNEGGRSLFYIAAVLSNVLKKNSVEHHIALAERVHGAIMASHPPAARTMSTPMPAPAQP